MHKRMHRGLQRGTTDTEIPKSSDLKPKVYLTIKPTWFRLAECASFWLPDRWALRRNPLLLPPFAADRGKMLFCTKSLSCPSRLFLREVNAVILHSLPIASTWYKAETDPCPKFLISSHCWESIFSFVNDAHDLLVIQEVFTLVSCVQHLFRQFMCQRGHFLYIKERKKVLIITCIHLPLEVFTTLCWLFNPLF